MKWFPHGLLILAGIVLIVAIINYFRNVRPDREKKIAMGLTANEGLILSLICRLRRWVRLNPLQRELRGLKISERQLDIILTRLRERGCVSKRGKHHRATGRGRRVAAMVAAAKKR